MRVGQLSVVLFCLAGSVVARASYEMVIFTTTTDRNFYRFDPVNRVQLGSFGAGVVGTYSGASVSLDSGRPGQIVSLNGDAGIRWANYSTGLQTGQKFLSEGQIYGNGPYSVTPLSNGSYVVNAYYGSPTIQQRSRVYNAAFSSFTEMSPFGSGYEPLGSAQGSDGRIYTLNRFNLGSGNFAFVTFGFTTAGTYLGYNSLGSYADAYAFGSILASGGRIYAGPGTQTTNPRIAWHPAGVSQTATASIATSYYSTTGWSNLVAGHDGKVHMIQSYYNGTDYTNQWYTYEPESNRFAVMYAMPYNMTISRATMVAAPEPATWAAIGLGLLAIVRRKRTR
ncbi:MAG: PEP-CTERM sorting domain-containing protein [Chthonomonas sp.]|nr:PEP-CTERM sorting domain-containing protein [Chthonomonas sp.]